MGEQESGKSWLEEAREVRAHILAARGGKPLPNIPDDDDPCCECGRDIPDVAEQVEKRKREVRQMAEEQRKAARRAKISRPKRVKRGSWLEEAIKFQEKVLERRGGKLLPDSSDWIRESRETEW